MAARNAKIVLHIQHEMQMHLKVEGSNGKVRVSKQYLMSWNDSTARAGASPRRIFWQHRKVSTT